MPRSKSYLANESCGRVVAAMLFSLVVCIPFFNQAFAWEEESGLIAIGNDSLEPAVSEVECKLVIGGKSAPKVGDTLEVDVSGFPEDAIINWYVGSQSDNASFVCSGGSLLLNDEMLCSFVFARVEEDGAVLAEDSFYFSDLPVVYITTDDGADIDSKEEYKHAFMSIQGNSEFGIQYAGGIQIKGRGNSTWELEKKPYRVKLDDKSDLFGMGKNKHWVLLANCLDPSLVRNTVAQDIACVAGLVTMDSVWVDVVLNGRLIGNYQLSEHIRIGDSRVQIFDWEDLAGSLAKAVWTALKSFGMTKDERDALEDALCEDLSWVTDGSFTWNGETFNVSDYGISLPVNVEGAVDISGGYLFELSIKFNEVSQFKTVPSNIKVMVSKPEYLVSNDEMMQYVQSVWNAWNEAIISEDSYANHADGLAATYLGDIADIDSMVSYWLCMELVGNNDAEWNSRWAYKDLNGKIEFGPLWDFDYGFASIPIGWTNGDGWKIEQQGGAGWQLL